MSGQGGAANGAAAAEEPMSKRRRLLDAGGPVEDDQVARKKMRGAKVGWLWTAETRSGYTGFDPDTVNQQNPIYVGEYLTSPMGYFSHEGDLPMMRWLYVKGADTRDDDVSYWCPLHVAASNGKLEACQWLYEHGAAKDIKRRMSDSPLTVVFNMSNRRDMSRWLILKGALCKDGSSGDLDFALLRNDLNRYFSAIEERQVLLEWASEHHRTREAFLAFLTGSHSSSHSPSASRNLAKTLHGLPGVLETISDFAGVLKGREARIIRQLAEILPDLNVELDEEWEESDSDESSSNVSEEDDEEDSHDTCNETSGEDE